MKSDYFLSLLLSQFNWRKAYKAWKSHFHNALLHVDLLQSWRILFIHPIPNQLRPPEEHWDAILVHSLSEKMDPASRKQWQLVHLGTDLFTWEQLPSSSTLEAVQPRLVAAWHQVKQTHLKTLTNLRSESRHTRTFQAIVQNLQWGSEIQFFSSIQSLVSC